MEKLQMNKQNKNEYIRFVLRILKDKYHVNISSIGEDLGLNTSSIRVFYSGSRNVSEETLEKIEDYLIEMYGALLESDLLMYQPTISRWLKSS